MNVGTKVMYIAKFDPEPVVSYGVVIQVLGNSVIVQDGDKIVSRPDMVLVAI